MNLVLPLASAHVCTNRHPAPTNADIEHAVGHYGEFVTFGQVIMALGLDRYTLPVSLEIKIRTWLDDAGWERVKKQINGARVWGYERPAAQVLMSASRKQVLLAATVLTPKAGQLLLPMPLSQLYSSSPCILLIDLEALSRNLALALASSDSSLKIASTSEVLSELSTALESAMDVCKRSKAAIASWSESGGTSSVLSSSRLTSNASGASLDSVSSMDFFQVLSKDTHGKAVLTAHQAGGAL